MSPRKRMPALEALTPKQQGFVADLIETGNQAEAYRRNYAKTTDLIATVEASKLANKPHVKEAIQEVIENKYPQLKAGVATFLHDVVTGLEPDAKISDRLKAIEVLARLQGWLAPTEHNTRKLVVNVDKFKLPGDK